MLDSWGAGDGPGLDVDADVGVMEVVGSDQRERKAIYGVDYSGFGLTWHRMVQFEAR